jgi:hypothetical protein
MVEARSTRYGDMEVEVPASTLADVEDADLTLTGLAEMSDVDPEPPLPGMRRSVGDWANENELPDPMPLGDGRSPPRFPGLKETVEELGGPPPRLTGLNPVVPPDM